MERRCLASFIWGAHRRWDAVNEMESRDAGRVGVVGSSCRARLGVVDRAVLTISNIDSEKIYR